MTRKIKFICQLDLQNRNDVAGRCIRPARAPVTGDLIGSSAALRCAGRPQNFCGRNVMPNFDIRRSPVRPLRQGECAESADLKGWGFVKTRQVSDARFMPRPVYPSDELRDGVDSRVVEVPALRSVRHGVAPRLAASRCSGRASGR
jgi:hypothetical protein